MPKRSRRELILDSAALQLANFGVGTSSLPEIAACMGLTRSALYYYAKSKEDLIFQVYLRSCDILAETAEAIRASPVPAPDRLGDFVQAITARAQVDVIDLSEVGMLGAQQKAAVLARYESAVAAIAAILGEGAACGELRACDAEVAARTIVSIVQQLCMLRVWTRRQATISPLGDQPRESDGLVTGAKDVLLHGWTRNRRVSIPRKFIDPSRFLVPPASAFDRQGQARTKREEILITASRLFNQRGVTSTTLDDIAAALGATKRTLYHHVGDKQALLTACHQRTQTIIKGLYAEYDRRVENGENAETAYVNYLRSTVLTQARPDIGPLRPAVGIPELTEAARRAHAEYVNWLLETAAIQMGRLQAGGMLRAGDTDALGAAHIGGVNWLAKGLVTIAGDRLEDIACEVVDVLRLGLMPLA